MRIDYDIIDISPRKTFFLVSDKDHSFPSVPFCTFRDMAEFIARRLIYGSPGIIIYRHRKILGAETVTFVYENAFITVIKTLKRVRVIWKTKLS
jgi:hypothetical protein